MKICTHCILSEKVTFKIENPYWMRPCLLNIVENYSLSAVLTDFNLQVSKILWKLRSNIRQKTIAKIFPYHILKVYRKMSYRWKIYKFVVILFSSFVWTFSWSRTAIGDQSLRVLKFPMGDKSHVTKKKFSLWKKNSVRSFN